MTAGNWIQNGEKYAFVGLSLKVADNLPVGPIGRNLWLLADTSFTIPDQWPEWLGSIRTGQLDDCNVFLLSKAAAQEPGVLDGENQRLQHLVSCFYYGLLLSSRFAPSHRPVLMTGSRRDGQIDIRQLTDFDAPVPCDYRFYPEVLAAEFTAAARLAEAILDIETGVIAGGHWRLFRALHVYLQARTTPNALERLHQYCRCIEGMIGAAQGRSKSQFKSRTEIFIGPTHHDLLGKIYDVRSDVEHLHEDRHIMDRDRAKRLDLVAKEAIIENLARRIFAHILAKQELWGHFANRDSIDQFWALPVDDQALVWGPGFDLFEPLAEFDPQSISNGQIGLC